MRFACLLLEHLPVRVEERLDPDLILKPVVIIRDWDDRVLDVSPDVIGRGITPGDSRRRVRQLCPEAVILPARESLYQDHHDALKAVLSQFANAVETQSLGEMLIDVGGLARTFPSEKALALHIAVQAQRDTHLMPTVGVAANKFTAARAAREAAEETSRTLVVADGDEQRFLAPLPLTALPDPPIEMLRRLHLLGITTLGGFGALPHAAVTLQFGADLAFLHDLARGRDSRPLMPQSPPPMVTRTLRLPEPLADRLMVLSAIEHLAGGLARELERSGYHAVELALVVSTTDEREQTAGVPVKPPSNNADHLRRLAGRMLDKLTLEAEASELTIRAYPLREWHLGARQLEMFEPATSPKLVRLREVLRILRTRFDEAIVQLASLIGPPLPLPIQVQARRDGTPAALRWRGWSRLVEKVYEYWQESRQWWNDDPIVRDHYLVETKEGVVYSVFRDGRGRWYLDRRRG